MGSKLHHNSNGGNIDYRFGSKNNWRRWAWNQAKKRIYCRPKDAIVLYLPSKQNIDMSIAIQKGFNPKNMFGVERDPGIVKHLRSQKVNVIQGDFNDVLLNWGEEPKIDVVMADFCCGLNETVLDFLVGHKYSKGIKPGAAILVNMLRGRDKWSTYMRQFYGDKKCFQQLPKTYNVFRNALLSEKHRGVLFSCLLMMRYGKAIVNGKEFCKVPDLTKANYMDNLMCHLFHKVFRFSYKEYRSCKGSLIMDSVSFNHACCWGDPHGYIQPPGISGKIAAAKAVRTMRITG